jgi:hypothetical protein
MRNAVLAGQECAEKVYTNGTPELFLRRIGDPGVHRPGTTGVVVDHMKGAKPVNSIVIRCGNGVT